MALHFNVSLLHGTRSMDQIALSHAAFLLLHLGMPRRVTHMATDMKALSVMLQDLGGTDLLSYATIPKR